MGEKESKEINKSIYKMPDAREKNEAGKVEGEWLGNGHGKPQRRWPLSKSWGRQPCGFVGEEYSRQREVQVQRPWGKHVFSMFEESRPRWLRGVRKRWVVGPVGNEHLWLLLSEWDGESVDGLSRGMTWPVLGFKKITLAAGWRTARRGREKQPGSNFGQSDERQCWMGWRDKDRGQGQGVDGFRIYVEGQSSSQTNLLTKWPWSVRDHEEAMILPELLTLAPGMGRLPLLRWGSCRRSRFARRGSGIWVWHSLSEVWHAYFTNPSITGCVKA